jgi:hypothetical protein
MAAGSRRYREVQLGKLYRLKPLLLRALNRNQILILSEAGGACITPLLKELSASNSIPLSTLKLNARILKEMGLLDYKGFRQAEPTEYGDLVLSILASSGSNG